MLAASDFSLAPVVDFFLVIPKAVLLGYVVSAGLACGIYWGAGRLDRVIGREQRLAPIDRAEYSYVLHGLRRTFLRRAMAIGGLLELTAIVFVILLALAGIIDSVEYFLTSVLIATICALAIFLPPLCTAYIVQKSDVMRRVRAE